MVPDSFHDFFVASAGVSGALIGLLFVATAIAPERILQKEAPAQAQETAAGAFIVLSNTLFVALAALIPSSTVGGMAMVAAIGGIVGTLMFAGLTWIHRAEGGVGLLWGLRRLMLLGLFVWQMMLGYALLGPTTAVDKQLGNLCLISLIFYGIGLSRAWVLLGGRGHGLGDAIRLFWEERQAKRAKEAS